MDFGQVGEGVPGSAQILGAVLAGGTASRFGSDKALAMLDEKPLLAHALYGLQRYTNSVVVCGREWPDHVCLDDGEFTGEGPLAGLLAALRCASDNGWDAVLTMPCDALPVPDMTQLFGDGPAVFAGHWLFGYWPAALAIELKTWLTSQPDRSLRGWLFRCEALEVEANKAIYNFNAPEELAAYADMVRVK